MARKQVALFVFGVAVGASVVGVAANCGGAGVRGATPKSPFLLGGWSGRRGRSRGESDSPLPKAESGATPGLGWERYRHASGESLGQL
jgi:hypothetical protein